MRIIYVIYNGENGRYWNRRFGTWSKTIYEYTSYSSCSEAEGVVNRLFDSKLGAKYFKIEKIYVKD